MRGYRRAWRTWWLLLALAGTVAAVLLWPGPVVLLVWLFGAALGLMGVTATRGHADDSHPFERVSLRDVTTGVLSGALVTSGVIGWIGVSGGGGLALAVCAGLSHPRCVAGLRELLPESGAAPGPARTGAAAVEESLGIKAGDEVSLARVTRLLSTQQLCAAWQQTFTGGDPWDTQQQLRALRLREAFLDELARRDPVGLEAWMSSTVPASTAPSDFFRLRPPDVSS